MKRILFCPIASALAIGLALLAGCSGGSGSSDRSAMPESSANVRGLTTTQNPAAYIPAQCYTKPQDARGTSNPCYVCHTDNKAPNFINDGETQTTWGFPENALKNHWRNPFIDHSATIDAISNVTTDSYVAQSNYQDAAGKLLLARRLEDIPDGWDGNHNGQWDGYVPDAYYNFDNQGFDRTPDDHYTGWRAFAYFPVPGAFMPTNGSTDDVLIRLDPPYRQNREGQFSLPVYKTNLAIVQSLIQRRDITIDPVDERGLETDLDGNGHLGTANHIHYDWDPINGHHMTWVGKAGTLTNDQAPLAAGLFPLGTEFLHSVRYLQVKDDQSIAMAPRMKELRYAKKTHWNTYYDLKTSAMKDIKERHDFPARLKQVPGNVETGVVTNLGWRYQGFIEARDGSLRPQSYEESLTCNGCHSGVGATTDGTFAFARKVPDSSIQKGWYHWTQKSLAGTPDPKRTDGQGEYAFYVKHNPWGNAFRSNDELHNRFFTATGQSRKKAFAALAQDIATVLQPTPQRARKLNKAYLALVEEQSFKAGRDAFIKPPEAEQHEVLQDQETGITEVLSAF